MGDRYLPAALEKNPGLAARRTAVCGEDTIYISICSGGAAALANLSGHPPGPVNFSLAGSTQAKSGTEAIRRTSVPPRPSIRTPP
jgi:hypothetical protein